MKGRPCQGCFTRFADAETRRPRPGSEASADCCLCPLRPPPFPPHVAPTCAARASPFSPLRARTGFPAWWGVCVGGGPLWRGAEGVSPRTQRTRSRAGRLSLQGVGSGPGSRPAKLSFTRPVPAPGSLHLPSGDREEKQTPRRRPSSIKQWQLAVGTFNWWPLGSSQASRVIRSPFAASCRRSFCLYCVSLKWGHQCAP